MGPPQLLRRDGWKGYHICDLPDTELQQAGP